MLSLSILPGQEIKPVTVDNPFVKGTVAQCRR
jgi:hypothetical protein